MWNRLIAPAPERNKTQPRARRIQGKYDWRLWSRQRDKAGSAIDPSYSGLSPVGAGGGGSGTSAPEDLPAGLFASGSRGSMGARSPGRSNENTDDVVLLLPGRGMAATPGSSVSSHGPGFLYTPSDGAFRLSRTTSVDSVFDDSQERCIHTAYRVSFTGDKRVKEKPFRIVIDGVSFVLVERVVSGHSDGVYQKSKKIWEHIPRGQVRVFASVATTPLQSFPSSPNGGIGSISVSKASACGPGNGGKHRQPRSVSPTDSLTGGSFASTHTLVASLNGLRKFAHWGDTSSNIYNVNKEVPAAAIAVEKVDGESCHVTGFSLEGERYWLVGLRDRHLLVRLDVPQEDIVAYAHSDAPRPANYQQSANEDSSAPSAPSASVTPASNSAQIFTNASMKVAAAWRCLLEEHLSKAEIEELHQHLSEKQWTLCFDAVVMGCEHFVDYYSPEGDDDGEVEEKEGSPSHSPPRDWHGDRDGTHQSASPLSQEQCSPTTSERSSAAQSDAATTQGDETLGRDPKEDALPLIFYAVTFHEPSEKGLCLPVGEAMSFFERFHLPTASKSEALEVNSPEYDALRAQINSALDSAGSVFYGTNEQGLVVRLWKCRCYPYELERAAQEFIVTHRLHGSAFLAKFQKKLSGLSKEVRASAAAWEKKRLPFLNDFAEWLHSTRQLSPSTDLASLQVLRGHWVTAQHAFQHDRKVRGERVAGVALGGGDEDGACGDNSESRGADTDDTDEMVPETILLAGPQGCGKSTLARALYSLLEQAGCTPRWINQDEVGNRKAYLAAIHHAARCGTYTHIILDKMNLDESSREEYNGFNLKTVLVVAWSHPQGTEALVNVCFDRVKRRGASHRSFKVTLDLEERTSNEVSTTALLAAGNSATDNASPKPQPTVPPTCSSSSGNESADLQLRRLRGILADCAARYELPEGNSNLLELEVTLNCNTTIQRVWSKLREQTVYELPGLNQLDVEEAFSVAFGYEKLMRTYPNRITAVVLQANAPEELKEMVTHDILEGGGKKPLEQVHVVLQNFIEEPSPVSLVHYASKIGKLAMVDIQAVVADPKATLLHIGNFSTEGGSSSAPGASSCSPKPQKSPPWQNKDPKGVLHTLAGENGGCGESLLSSQSSESPESSLRMAVLAKAKKATYRYCTQLLERVVLRGEPDPYVVVQFFPRGTCAPFTFHFVTQ